MNCHLVAHVVAYVISYKNMNGWKCTSILYICVYIICHMQLKLVVNDSCKRQVLRKCLNPLTRSSYFNKL
jgi:hypothetical protein